MTLHTRCVPSDRPSSDKHDFVMQIERGAVVLPARSREVGVATEMLLTKAEQVLDDGTCSAGLRLKLSCQRGYPSAWNWGSRPLPQAGVLLGEALADAPS